MRKKKTIKNHNTLKINQKTPQRIDLEHIR